MKAVDRDAPIAEVAAFVPGATSVFEDFGIDYSSVGHLSVEDACLAEGIDPADVVRFLEPLAGDAPEPWCGKPIPDLTRHLAAQHRALLQKELPELGSALAEACHDAPQESALRELRIALTELMIELIPHLAGEERHLFRSIEEHLPDLQLRVRDTVVEHGTIAARLRRMRAVRLRAAEEELAPAAREVVARVAGLEAALHESMFLENCVLLPRAICATAAAGAS
jgi:regulator of cell morphogenesis and NO signaling